MTVAAGRVRTTAFVVVGAAWFAMMAGSNVATPLYAIYEGEFGFSKAVLTLVFATYALVLAPSLLLFGQLSDRLGRRRVMAAGFATATVGLLLFALAGSLAWLFAARAVQGLAVGMISGAAAAALVELDPAPAGGPRGAVRRARPGGRERLRAADRGDAGRVGAGAARAAVRGLHRASASRRRSPRWRSRSPARVVARAASAIVRPSVPPEIRVLFARVSVTGAAVWAVAAFFLSVVPVLRRRTAGHLEPRAARRGQRGSCSRPRAWPRSRRGAAPRTPACRPSGSSCSRVGLVALVLAFPTRSLLVLLAAGLLAGAGHGIAFLGGQAQLNLAAPPTSAARSTPPSTR